MFPTILSRALLLFAACSLVLAQANAYDWEEISAEELASEECELDPTAPAEVLYKQIVYDLRDVDSYIPQRLINYHIRTKIYEKSALDNARRTKLTYSTKFKASSIQARVIKPDGSYIKIDRDDVVTQSEFKQNKKSFRSTTISLPQVEVGDIVEYKYRLVLDKDYYLPKDEVSFQEEWPIRTLHLKMKPFVYFGYGFKWVTNHVGESLEAGSKGFFEITLNNQTGYPDEPYQAPDTDARAWVTFYNVQSKHTGDKFWTTESQRLYKELLTKTKADKEVAAKAEQLSAGKKTDKDKLIAFYDYCRSELVNAYYSTPDQLTGEQISQLDSEWTASKTLKMGFGTSRNINTVFCALARAVGIDARLSRCADRSDFNFQGNMEQVDVALPDTIVAVKNGEDWEFHNPGAKYMPFGQLDWYHDNVGVLVPDKKELILINTQAAKPEQSLSKSEGDFVLSENGTLTGSMKLVANGNIGYEFKSSMDYLSDSSRREEAEDMLKKTWPNAEISNIQVANVSDAFAPIEISFDVKMPGYAEVIGNRIFFQPNVKRRYAEPEFPEPTRKTNIFFDYKYREESLINIKLPEGYALEAPSAPHPINVTDFMSYEPKLALKKADNTIIYRSSLDFSGDRYLPAAYPIIKEAFDNLLTQDQHSLTLKKVEPNETSENS